MFVRILQCVSLAVCFFIASHAHAGLIITEVMFNPIPNPDLLNPGPADTEWIELYNTGPGSVDLSNYALVDGEDVSFGILSGTLAANEAIVLYDSYFALTNPTDPTPIYDFSRFSSKWGLTSAVKTLALFDWQLMALDLNPTKSKTLRLIELNPLLSEVVSLVRFDNYDPGSWPDPVSGHSMYLTDPTDPSPENWLTTDPLSIGDNEIGEYGSPGFVDFSTSILSAPEPSSIVVFACITGTVAFGRPKRQSV